MVHRLVKSTTVVRMPATASNTSELFSAACAYISIHAERDDDSALATPKRPSDTFG
jgi:hypothetical protein